MKEMNRTELIELVAAVSLRVLAFTYALAALERLVTSACYFYVNNNFPQHASGSQQANHYSFVFLVGPFLVFVLEMAQSLIFYLLAVPLARLVTRGLSHSLEPKPAVA
jgi:hypothetical protein